jgi:hypothetical protein
MQTEVEVAFWGEAKRGVVLLLKTCLYVKFGIKQNISYGVFLFEVSISRMVPGSISNWNLHLTLSQHEPENRAKQIRSESI